MAQEKIVWWLFAATFACVVISLSQYVYPWGRVIFGNSPARVQALPQKQVVKATITLAPKIIPNVFFTKGQILMHDKIGDCWITLNGEVYDLTKIIGEVIGASNGSLNAQEICGNDLTPTINKLMSQYGIKDISQVTATFSQYGVGKVK